jgi:hypothetical protein
MTLQSIMKFLGLWSLIGASLFCVFVIVAFRSGLVYTARNEDGLLKDQIPLRGYIAMASFLLSVIAFIIIADYYSIAKNASSVGAFNLFIVNYCLYLILFLFDTLVIDGFVLGYWRPKFLRLSEQMGRESMGAHMLKSIPIGMGFGVLITLLSTLFSYFVILS